MGLHYRIYLLDADDHIIAAESFLALDHTDALEIATVLCRSTYDACRGFELWQGQQRVGGTTLPSLDEKLTFAEMVAEQQSRVIELEERLQEGFVCIRESRALLEALAEVQEPRLQIDQRDRSNVVTRQSPDGACRC